MFNLLFLKELENIYILSKIYIIVDGKSCCDNNSMTNMDQAMKYPPFISNTVMLPEMLSKVLNKLLGDIMELSRPSWSKV